MCSWCKVCSGTQVVGTSPSSMRMSQTLAAPTCGQDRRWCKMCSSPGPLPSLCCAVCVGPQTMETSSPSLGTLCFMGHRACCGRLQHHHDTRTSMCTQSEQWCGSSTKCCQSMCTCWIMCTCGRGRLRQQASGASSSSICTHSGRGEMQHVHIQPTMGGAARVRNDKKKNVAPKQALDLGPRSTTHDDHAEYIDDIPVTRDMFSQTHLGDGDTTGTGRADATYTLLVMRMSKKAKFAWRKGCSEIFQVTCRPTTEVRHLQLHLARKLK
eukprot:4530588-Amphidinium_carterae.1